MRILLLPTFKTWEKLAIPLLYLLLSEVLAGMTVHLIGKLGAVINHLLHSKVLCELSLLEAIDTIVGIGGAVGVGAQHIGGEWHAATLTKFLFHNKIYFIYDKSERPICDLSLYFFIHQVYCPFPDLQNNSLFLFKFDNRMMS